MRRFFFAALVVTMLTCPLWAQRPTPGQQQQPPRQLPPPPVPRGTDWSDWGSPSNNGSIVYRYRFVDSGKACFLEFKDQLQGDDYTSFDAEVEYKSTNPDGDVERKRDNLHLATTMNRTATSQIANCLAVVDVVLNFVRRH